MRSEDERDESGSELRAVASVETGLEFDAARLSRRFRLKLRLGVTAWLPFGDVGVDITGQSETIQSAGSSVSLGWVFTLH